MTRQVKKSLSENGPQAWRPCKTASLSRVQTVAGRSVAVTTGREQVGRDAQTARAPRAFVSQRQRERNTSPVRFGNSLCDRMQRCFARFSVVPGTSGLGANVGAFHPIGPHVDNGPLAVRAPRESSYTRRAMKQQRARMSGDFTPFSDVCSVALAFV